MSNIVELKPRPKQQNEETVEMLKSALARAERGEIVSIALAGVMDDGSSFSTNSASDNFQLLLAAVAILQFRMIAERTVDTLPDA